MVDRIEIVGAHAEADGIRAEGTMQLTITATTVRKARHGIHLTGRNRNVLISDSHTLLAARFTPEAHVKVVLLDGESQAIAACEAASSGRTAHRLIAARSPPPTRRST